jgi:hypothetical protein
MAPLFELSPLLLSLAAGVVAAERKLQGSARTMVNGGTVDLATCTNVESQFNIQAMYMGAAAIDERYEDAFELAAQRWTKVIVGDVPDLAAGLTDDWFGGQFASL